MLSDLVEYLAEPPKISPNSWVFEGPKIESRSSARDPLKELVARVDREGPLDPRSKFGAFEELAEEADIGADLPEGLNPKSEAKRPSKSFMAFAFLGLPLFSLIFVVLLVFGCTKQNEGSQTSVIMLKKRKGCLGSEKLLRKKEWVRREGGVVEQEI